MSKSMGTGHVASSFTLKCFFSPFFVLPVFNLVCISLVESRNPPKINGVLISLTSHWYTQYYSIPSVFDGWRCVNEIPRTLRKDDTVLGKDYSCLLRSVYVLGPHILCTFHEIGPHNLKMYSSWSIEVVNFNFGANICPTSFQNVYISVMK